EMDRVERLDDLVERSREETDLVPCRDGHRAALGQFLRHPGRFVSPKAQSRDRESGAGRRRQQLPPALLGGVEGGGIRIELRQSGEEVEKKGMEPRVFRERNHAGSPPGLRARTMSLGAWGPAGLSSKPPHADSTPRPAAQKSSTSSSVL